MIHPRDRIRSLTIKFGGTSLGSAEAIGQAAEITRALVAEDPRRVAVVASAVHGVTDLLREGALRSAGGEHEHPRIARQLREFHQRLARELAPAEEVQALAAAIEALLDGYADFCDSVGVLGEAGPRALDHAMSLGERLSVPLLVAALRRLGVRAVEADARQLIVTDDRFQNAAPDWEATRQRVSEGLHPIFERGETPVIHGFIGSTAGGITTTLGRGGSDLSAGVIAACLGSDELWIWTDVDGVMTADPRVVPAARTIETLTYQEVRELSYFGAKVLHPRTIQSVREENMCIRVKNTFNPTHPGTLIVPGTDPAEAAARNRAVKAITAIPDVSLVTVEGKGMIGVPGVAAHTFEAVARTGASVLLISQASSEQSICFAIPRPRAAAAIRELEAEFELALSRGDIDRVWALDDITIVTVVGSGMRQTPGIAGRIFTATGSRNINIVAIAQGSSECSISLVVQDRDGDAAVRAIHDLVIEG
jgi:aspartate kinase